MEAHAIPWQAQSAVIKQGRVAFTGLVVSAAAPSMCAASHPEDVVDGAQAVDSVLDLKVKRGTRHCLNCAVDWRVRTAAPGDGVGDGEGRVCSQAQQLEDSCQGGLGHRDLEVARVKEGATPRALGAEVNSVGSQGGDDLCRCEALNGNLPLSSNVDVWDARGTAQPIGVSV